MNKSSNVLKFIKMEGIGNDFIITHSVDSKNVIDVAKHVSFLCDRRRGIGADGVIFVLPSDTANFSMRIFNSDGSEAEMCGNGVRCFSLYVKLLKLSSLQYLSIQTLAGLIQTELVGDLIRVNMNTPRLDAIEIPVAQPAGKVVMKELRIKDSSFKITAVSMGNPHSVIFVDTLTDDLVNGFGPLIECHPFFPKKTNVEFVKVLSNNEIAIRVWERGCGETQACGTGACASVVAGIINKLHGKNVTVHLPGGDLEVEWQGNVSDPVYMTGPAHYVFSGSIEIPL